MTPPKRQLPPGVFRLGSVAGIDVTVANSWFLIVALIAVVLAPRIEAAEPDIGGWSYVAGIAFAVLLYGSVLLHEISHALAARAFQMPVHSINLHFLGGATQIEGEASTPVREFVIAVVGPLTSLVVSAVCWGWLSLLQDGLLRLVIGGLASANLVVGILNLVPGLPLDGGRVLQSLVWAISRRRSVGIVTAAWGGRVAALAAFASPVLVYLVFGRAPDILDYVFAVMISSFLWAGATEALVSSKVRSKLPALQARHLARAAIGVPADLPVSEVVRRAQESRAGSVIVVSTDGRPSGIVNEAAIASTPTERRPWVPAGDVARRIEDGLMLPADISGEALIRAMHMTPATEYVLVEADGSIFGVLVANDVSRAFRAA